MKKRIIGLFLSVLMALLILPPTSFSAQAADYASQLRSQGFPESYIPHLVALHNKYPNWSFEPLFTDESWSTAVSKERTSHSQQKIEKNTINDGKGYYCTCSSCFKNGSYVVQENPNWVSASQSAVEYYMDPRNFLNEKYVFQFETNFYNSSHTQDGVEAILAGTWMHNANITYKNAQGQNITYSPATKYSAAIMAAAKNSGLSAYYLASKIVQEVGGKTNSAGGASGTNANYPGIYNYYNIGAYTGAEDGLRWASSDSGYTTNVNANMRSASTTSSSIVVNVPMGTAVIYNFKTDKQSDGYEWYNVSATVGGKSYTGYIRSDLINYSSQDKYNRPWTNPYLSIYNGAVYIKNNFGTQYTGYLQKFNVNPASGSNMHGHEYMTSVYAAANESVKTYNAYNNDGTLAQGKTFSIPVFTDMPGELYIVKYDANGGSGAPEAQIKTHGKTLILSSEIPTRAGYTFLGWSRNKGATAAGFQPGGKYIYEESTTMYAVWKADTYTVKYDANGGSGAPSSQTKTHGKTLILSSEVPTRAGYTFLGWSRNKGATAAGFQPGGKYIYEESTTMYAVWKANT
ncbi:MAG: InlB B-repeat-containing protein [Eubacterium sp.]|nr:InlB B-repeat-containing protein [Eubacterium sp.]